MLVHLYWLSSLLSIASSSPTTYPTYNNISTNTSTTTNSTSTTTASIHHQTSPPTSANTSTTPPAPTSITSIPQTFYLVTNETMPGYYFKLVPNPYPSDTLNGDQAIGLDPHYQNSTGAANFSLNADDGTLQCNSDSGPLYASVPAGRAGNFILEFEHPSELERWGLVAVNCSGSFTFLDCRVGGEEVFYYDEGNNVLVLGPVETGEFVLIWVVAT